MDDRRLLGDWGEAAAADWLYRRGYRLVERGFRCRWGEIDLIALAPDGVLCFVEVKTRSTSRFAQAREAVTPAKQHRLRASAALYLAQSRLDCPCRFDVAEVYPARKGRPGTPEIRYIINAF